MRILLRTRTCIILACAMMLAQVGSAQTYSSDDGSRLITMTRFHTLIRQPGGLEKMADLLGNFSIDETVSERWGERDLPYLYHSSSLIVTATVENIATVLSSAADGDSVDTVFTLKVHSALKGDWVSQVSVRCSGGKYVFPNGNAVTIHTALSDAIQVGGEYVVFVSDVDGKLTLTNDIESAFQVSNESQTVHILQRDPDRDHSLRYLDGAPVSFVEQEVRKAAN